jgi:hypothetical protein
MKAGFLKVAMQISRLILLKESADFKIKDITGLFDCKGIAY